jgi:hypothetical protein
MAPARRKRHLKPRPGEDLFGEVPITWPEVYLWVETVCPRCSPWRVRWYVENWNVLDKIRAAKRSGDWPPVAETAVLGGFGIVAMPLAPAQPRLAPGLGQIEPET